MYLKYIIKPAAMRKDKPFCAKLPVLQLTTFGDLFCW